MTDHKDILNRLVADIRKQDANENLLFSSIRYDDRGGLYILLDSTPDKRMWVAQEHGEPRIANDIESTMLAHAGLPVEGWMPEGSMPDITLAEALTKPRHRVVKVAQTTDGDWLLIADPDSTSAEGPRATVATLVDKRGKTLPLMADEALERAAGATEIDMPVIAPERTRAETLIDSGAERLKGAVKGVRRRITNVLWGF